MGVSIRKTRLRVSESKLQQEEFKTLGVRRFKIKGSKVSLIFGLIFLKRGLTYGHMLRSHYNLEML